MDLFIVGIIVAGALFFSVRNFIKIYRGEGDSGCGCGAGCSCFSDNSCSSDLSIADKKEQHRC